MTSVPWSTTVLLSVLAACASVLAWKGVISSHMISGMMGAIVGYIVRQGFEQVSVMRAAARARDSGEKAAKFGAEAPTNPGKKNE
jgi:hypothetical protein